MSEEEYRTLLKRTGKAVDNIPAEQKTAKYRNKKVYIYSDGYVSYEKSFSHGDVVERFDSIKEYERAIELRLMQRAGMISDLRLQTYLLIQPTFKGRDGKTRNKVGYRADFMYVENGTTIVEDVKGFNQLTQKHITTEAFRIKWKLLQAKYPEYTFRIY